MQKLSGALDTEAYYDDELADLSHRCQTLHGRCAKLHESFRLRQDGEDDGQAGPEAPEPRLTALGTAAELRGSLSQLARRLTRPPEQPPPLPLLAERIRREVNEAVVPGHSLSAVRGRLSTFFRRRRDRLAAQCSMITGRVRRYVRDWEAAQRVGPSLEVRLRLLQREMEAAESRLRRLKPMEPVGSDGPIARASTGERLFSRNEAYRESTLSCVFKGDVAVCLREVIFEDRATRSLRRFLRCVQHLPVSHRGVVWRRALELQAAVRGADWVHAPSGAAAHSRASTPRCGSAELPPPPLPLKRILRSERLDTELANLSLEVGCPGILRTDEGHAFARSVLTDFPVLFERQNRRMHFPPHPENGPPQAEGGGSASASSSAATGGGAPAGGLPLDGSAGAAGAAWEGSEEEEGPFRRDDSWLGAVLLQPRVDLLVAEQRVLMRGAEEPRRAATPAGQAAAGGDSLGPTSAATAGVDPELREELEFLKAEDGKAAEARLRDLARERAQQAREEAEEEAGLEDEKEGEERKEAPEHLLKSYYLLRHLQGRALRRQLLDLLNLYRYAQQRLAHGVLALQLAGGAGGPAAPAQQTAAARRRSAEATSAEVPAAGRASSLADAGSVSAREAGGAALSAEPGRAPPSLAPGGYGQRPGALDRSPGDAFASLSDTERAITVPVAVGSAVVMGSAVVDGHGIKIMHGAALDDLQALEEEILSIGSHVIRTAPPALRRLVDKAGVLADLLAAEVKFHQAKWRLLEPYLEAYEHVAEPSARLNTAQRIVDVMAQRPHFDLKDHSFVEAYAVAAAAAELRADLLKKVLTHQLKTDQAVSSRLSRHLEVSMQRNAAATAAAHAQHPAFSRSKTGIPSGATSSGPAADPQLSMSDDLAHEEEGFPLPLGTAGLEVRTVPTAAECLPIDLLDFCATAGLAWQVDLLVEEAAEQLSDRLAPEVSMRHPLEQACAVIVAERWAEEVAGSSIGLLAPAAGDVLGHEAMDDPAWLMLLLEDSLRELWTSPDFDASVERSPTIRSAAGSRTPSSRPPNVQLLADMMASTSSSQPAQLAEQSPSRLSTWASERAPDNGTGGTRPTSAVMQAVGRSPRVSIDAGRTARSSIMGRSRCSFMSQKSDVSIVSEPQTKGLGRATPSKMLLSEFPEFAGLPYDEVLLSLYCNLLEHVTLRRRLADAAHEARALEAALTRQAELVGAGAAGSNLLRSEPIPELENLVVAFGSALQQQPGAGAPGDGRPKRSGVLLASDVESSFGQVDLSTGQQILVYCRSYGLRELRHILQHELAAAWLYVTCALHNAIVLDPMVRRQALAEASDRRPCPSKSTPRRGNAAERGAQLLRELRRTSDLSPPWRPSAVHHHHHSASPHRSPLGRRVRSVGSPDRRGTLGKAELTRLAGRCQFPAQVKAPVWVGVGGAVRESGRIFRKTMEGITDQAERKRRLSTFRHRFLAYASIYLAERACDLAVRVQAAHALTDLRAMAALMPDEVSPFKLSTLEDPKVMVDADGALTNLFHLPMGEEVLAMRGTALGSIDFTRCIREQERKMLDMLAPDGGAEQHALQADSAAPTLEPSFQGPASLVLALAQELAPIAALSFFSGSLGGDRQLLLRLHHAVGSARHDATAARKAAAEVLDISLLGTVQMEDFLREPEPQTPEQLTWDALQGLRMDFMNLAAQVRSIQASDGSPLPVLGILRKKRLCATMRAALLLQGAKRSALSEGDAEGAAELSRWSLHLEAGLEVRGGAHVLLASSHVGGGEGGQELDAQSLGPEWQAEAGGLEAARRLTMLARHGEPGASGLQRFGRFSHEDGDDELPGDSGSLERPDLELLHPAARAVVALVLAGSHSSEICEGAASGPGGSLFGPHCGRVAWQLPELPLQAVTRALCLLSPGLRERSAEQHLRLEMQCDAYLEAKGAPADQADSVDEELELCQTLFTADRLRTVALCLRLKAPPPQSREELQRLEVAFASLAELRPSHQEGEEDNEDGQKKTGETKDTVSGEQGVLRSGRQRSSSVGSFAVQQMHQERDKRKAVRAQIRDTYNSVSCYAASIQKSVMRSGVAKLAELQEELEAKFKGKDEGSEAALRFVGHLRARGILVETFGDKGGSSWIYKEHDLDEIVSEMGHRLLQWACRAADEQHASARARLSDSSAKVTEVEQRLLQARLDVGREKDELEARLTAAVADRGWRPLFEIDRLHRVIRCTAAAALEMEHRLGVEIQNTVLKELGTLDSELIKVCGRYQEYSESMLKNVQDELQALRQTLLQQLRNMGSSNFVLQQRVKNFQEDPAWQEGSSGAQAPELQQPVQVVSASGLQDPPQESVEDYHLEIRELEWAASRLQTLHQLKFQQMQEAFGKELVDLQAKLSSNTALWERVSEVRERQRVVDEEFSGARKRQVAASNAIERLNGEVTRNAKACEMLETWKDRTAKVQERLENQLQRYEREGLPDARKIESDLSQINSRIHQITSVDSVGHRMGMVQDRFEKHRKHLLKQARKEQELAQKAKAKATLIRTELERGQHEDDESLVKLAYEDYQDLTRRISEVEAENRRLQEVLDGSPTAKGLMAARMGAVASPSAKEVGAQQTFEEKLCYSIGYIKTPRHWGFGQNQIDQVHGGSGAASRSMSEALRSLSEPPPPGADAPPSPATSAYTGHAATSEDRHNPLSARNLLPPAHRTRFGSSMLGPVQAHPDSSAASSFSASGGSASSSRRRGTIAALSAAAGAAAASASSTATTASVFARELGATAPGASSASPPRPLQRMSISESPRRPSTLGPRQSLRRHSLMQQHYEGQGILAGAEMHRRQSRPPLPTPRIDAAAVQALRELAARSPQQGSVSSASSDPSSAADEQPRRRPLPVRLNLTVQPTASGTQGRAQPPQHLSPVSSTGTLHNH